LEESGLRVAIGVPALARQTLEDSQRERPHVTLVAVFAAPDVRRRRVVKGSITRALSYLLLVCDELLVYEGLKLLVYEALLRLYQGSIKAL
jgi:hypothetical protein